MADYYVSAIGDDSNDGSSSSPWKTITRVNTAFTAGLGLYNQVLLRRGDTFFGRLRPPTNLAASGWLKIGAYGTGAAPVVSGYKILNTASGWTAYDANTWQVDYSAANAGVTYTGYDSVQGDGDVGFLKVDGVIHAAKKSSLAALANQWDFYSTGTTLYVRSTAKPTTLAADIRCSVDGIGIIAKTSTEISDLTITGHGGHGVRMPGAGAYQVRVLRNTISEIGGSYLDGFGDGTVRYGNGIEVWIGGNSTNFYGERNTIHDCYDTAYTIQGGSSGVANAATDITWRRNLTYRCSQAEEYFYAGDGNGFVNCLSEYNTNLFLGYGFGAIDKPTYLLVAVLTTAWGDNVDLTLRRNIYYDASTAFSFSNEATPGLVSSRNVVALRPGTKMQWQRTETIEQAATWSAAVARDEDSTFGVLLSSADVPISDADVTTAIANLDQLATTGQLVGGKVFPIHSPWRVP